MCGLHGILNGTYNQKSEKFLSDAFVANQLRGMDSSGIALIDASKLEYTLHKLPVAGQHFITDSTVMELLEESNAKRNVAICHVRAATVGKISLSNAHPFDVGEDYALLGAHNGTLTNWKHKPDASKYTVDSEWALAHISKNGIKAFEDFSGAFAFTWWSADTPDNLYMARNKERSLAVAFLDNGGMAWASEPGMLFWLLERNSIKLDGPIIQLEEGKLYSFPIATPKEFTKTELPESKVVYYPAQPYANNIKATVSTVDSVKSLLNSIKKQDPAPLMEAEVSPEEIKEAEDTGWLNEFVEFTPVEISDKGYTEGLCEAMGYVFDATIRHNLMTLDFNKVWKCKVIGVEDDAALGQILILAAPSKILDPEVTIN